MSEDTDERAKALYDVYCAAFMDQKTLRPRHPGQMLLASWEEQREEIRNCWRAVAMRPEPTRWTRNRIVPPELADQLPPHPIEFALGDHDDGRSCPRCGFSVPSSFSHSHAVWCRNRYSKS